jgi:hypothetical protein
MTALPHDSARPFNRKIGFVYANYFANHFHNAAFHPSYFLDQLVQSHKMKNPQPVAAHLLVFDDPFRNQGIDRGFRQAGRNAPSSFMSSTIFSSTKCTIK